MGFFGAGHGWVGAGGGAKRLLKVITSYILSMASPTKFCHMTQIILWMQSCDQSLVTLAFV